MSVAVKRKRGRPRLDEPKEIKDFDNNLILEFKKYPVFYDRQHPQHRNRDYTDPIWQRISQNLNVTTSLVKTRMLQLRNRFNLEKRRVEAMKEQPDSLVTSQWSLFENLSFLSNYVKTRRPYSVPGSNNPRGNSTASSSDGEAEDDDNDIEASKRNGNILINKRKPDGLCAYQNHLSDDNGVAQHDEQTILQTVEADKDFGSKYNAFGQFLASSLIEMNEIQALNLVDKFTVELVKYLKNEERNKQFIDVSQRSNTDGDDENSLNVY